MSAFVMVSKKVKKSKVQLFYSAPKS